MRDSASIILLCGLILQLIGVLGGAGFVVERVFPKKQLRLVLDIRKYWTEIGAIASVLKRLQGETELLSSDFELQMKSWKDIESDIESEQKRIEEKMKSLENPTEDELRLFRSDTEALGKRMEDFHQQLEQYSKDTGLRNTDLKTRIENIAKRSNEVRCFWVELITGKTQSSSSASSDMGQFDLDNAIQAIRKPSVLPVVLLFSLLAANALIYPTVHLIWVLINAIAFNTNYHWYSWVLSALLMAMTILCTGLFAYWQLPKPIRVTKWQTYSRFPRLFVLTWVRLSVRTISILVTTITFIILWLPSLVLPIGFKSSRDREYYYATYTAIMFGVGIVMEIVADFVK